MEDKNEIQNQEFILPGTLGTVKIASTGKVSNVTKLVKDNDGTVTLTLLQVVDHYLNGIPITEDTTCEVIEPRQLENESGGVASTIENDKPASFTLNELLSIKNIGKYNKLKSK